MDSDTRIIEQVTRMGDLYDLYGALLTDRQKEMVELYYLDDWSLSEIASHFGVSRQAVHDNLHRSAEQLETYESALSLLETTRRDRELIKNLQTVFSSVRDHLPEAEQDEMQSALDALAAAWRMD
ncbi:YlxM family DNA-binding protein [Alicyclobacillus mengziensis]|uniref:YlxM family DNA-binding protein n=1 Tax=Alicyclobacillus mengziensis TaxID=2931921 RepID=UPI002013A703|nr:YlxM family DNA-binding protein [Alicyclobacillus mengziensis]